MGRLLTHTAFPSSDIMKIQLGIGDKIATFVQWVTTFFAGYTVGFIQGWELTLIILAVAPFMVVTVGVIAVVSEGFFPSVKLF